MAQKLIRFDWAMKRLLRNKSNFDILEGFLSELLFEDIKILNILESESNQEDLSDKSNRVDMLVKNSVGELIIIEVQNEREYDYLQRLVYGTSKAIVENMYKGMAYSEVKKIISISIVYFDLGQGKDYIYAGTTNFVGRHQGDVLRLNQQQIKLYGNKEVYQIFPEYYLLKVNNFDEIAKNTLDEWIYFFKTEEIKSEFKAKGLQKAKSEFEVMRMNDSEQAKYQQYLSSLTYQASIHESTFVLGKIEGKLETQKAFVLNCVKKGLDVSTIEELTNLSISEIQKMIDK